MSFTLETKQKITLHEIEQAAEITAMGFGRSGGEENYADTKAHFEGGDQIQLLHDDKELVGFAIYRRLLWR